MPKTKTRKTKSISLYFVSIIPEKSFQIIALDSETVMYPENRCYSLIRSIFVDYIVANGLRDAC